MKAKIWLCAIGVALGFYTALAGPASADGYKSPAQIMEFASQLDNQGEKERAIRMYKALVEKYPDSRQAKMAQSRIDVLESRVAEERAAAEQARQREENRRYEERRAANSGHNAMCESNYQNCLASCESIHNANYQYYQCKNRCSSGRSNCLR